MRNAEHYADPTASAAIAGKNNVTKPNQGILKVELPLCPTINHYYFTARNGKRVMTASAKAWMQEARFRIQIESNRKGWYLSNGRKTIMRLWIYWPDMRRRDAGNLHKALGDAPEGIVYTDDRYLLIQDMDFQVDTKNPRVKIEIEEVKCDERI